MKETVARRHAVDMRRAIVSTLRDAGKSRSARGGLPARGDGK